MPAITIKLEEAKRAIAFPGFHSDELLKIALTDPCTINESGLHPNQQIILKREYRRLAFLGDMLIDAILADFLYGTRRELSHENFDDYRQDLVDRPSLSDFAISLGLPDVSSSWNRKNRKPPEDEPGVWGEMFEAVVGVLFLDADRNFDKVAKWLCSRFLEEVVEDYEEDPTLVTGDDYAEMIGLSNPFGILFLTSDGKD
jgi:ribonuclease III